MVQEWLYEMRPRADLCWTGSPLRCEVLQVASKKATATARGEGLNQVVLGTAAYFEVNPHTPEHGTIDAQVIGMWFIW